MPYSPDLIAGAAALAVTLALRAFTANRLVRSKLRLSLVAFSVYLLLVGALAGGWAAAPSDAALLAQIQSISRLLLALGLVTLVVVAAVNPWRVDRTPEHFPNIVQDAIIIGVFLVIGTSVMQEKFLTTSAVGAVVIGFALQDTLGNTFAGLAIQVEKPFRAGQWVRIGSFEGLVTAITWRATRLKTKNGDSVVMPNNILSKEAITNFSEPTTSTRLIVEVGVSYAAAPNDVKRVIAEAIRGLDLLLASPAPEVLVADFGASAIVYRVKFWIDDYAADDRARDQVRRAIYYALHRRHIEIPYPMQVQYRRVEYPLRSDQRTAELDRLVGSVDVFAPLTDSDRAALVAASADRLYGAGEAVVRQGDPGESMFIVGSGEVRVTLEPSGQEVARIPAGGYFGEMSLLTGEPRTATVSAVDDAVVLEITADTFRRLAAVHPDVVEQISLAVAARREGLERSREVAATSAVAAPEVRTSFLARVQKFLGFGS